MKQYGKILPVMLIMLFGAGARLIPHMPNFTPIESITIFGAAYFSQKYLSILMPLLLLYVTDFVINNTIARPFFTSHEGLIWFSSYMIYNAVAIIIIALVTMILIKKVTFTNISASIISSTLIFYLITNFGSWVGDVTVYSRDLSGLMASYTAGLPFLKISVLSNILFSGILFGSYAIFRSLSTERTNTIPL